MNDPTDVGEMAINMDRFKFNKGVIGPTLERQNRNTIFFPIIFLFFHDAAHNFLVEKY